MKEWKVEKKDCEDFVVFEVTLERPMRPEELPSLLEDVQKQISMNDYQKGAIISGRMPIWAHSAIAHLCHPFRWVGHFDPRLGRAVVTQSHDPEVPEGKVVPWTPEEKKKRNGASKRKSDEKRFRDLFPLF